uniref:Uncharacterized protein n=1 Tax=Faxonius propinquus nudivirus TaxID=3139431 RepID=A0AAU8GBS7_9VIRU
MVDILDISKTYGEVIKSLCKNAPNSFFKFKKIMYFYYGTKFNKYVWNKHIPIKILPTDTDITGKIPLIHIIPKLLPIVKDIIIIVYYENVLPNFPPPIIKISTHHLQLKKEIITYN